MSSSRPVAAAALATVAAAAVAGWLTFASVRTAFGESIQGDWLCTRSGTQAPFLMQVAANTVILRGADRSGDRYGTWFIDHNLLSIRGIFDTEVRVVVPDSLPRTLRGHATVPERDDRYAFDLTLSEGGDRFTLAIEAGTTLVCDRSPG